MIALKRILAPTDFSDASAAAMRYAVAFARAFQARLHVLHVESRQDLEILVEGELAVDRLLAQAGGPTVPRNPARELLARVLTPEEDRELHAEYVLRASGRGGVYVEIVRYAKERDVDLIVMGTHGHGFAAHMLLGNVTEKVVRRAPCPVLTVHPSTHEFVLPDTQ
jgi:nucleotide-binding universal stress UspA family protein